MANKDPNNAKSLLFRQVELNWINAPLEDDGDYIGLYLDSQPDENILPVSVHRLNGQTSGQIITDYYLPQIDFYNESISQGEDRSLYNLVPDLDDRRFGFRVNDWPRTTSIGTDVPQYQAPDLKSALADECIGYCLAYHSKNKVLAQNCLKINPTWMRDSFQYIGPRSLPSIMIPGTHNSGTYPKQLDKTVLHMINKYQMNQDESIFNQLVYGIRHLDLRVGYSKVKQRAEKFWIYHDIFRTEVSVNEVLAQVKRFLDLTSHEIVIMDFHRFTVGFHNENMATQRERHAKLIDLIFKQLDQYIVPSYLGQHASLNDYKAMGKRLIVGYANKANILASSQADHQSILAVDSDNGVNKQQVRDIDGAKHLGQQQEKPETSSEQPIDRRVGTRIFNKLKALKLISNSFSKRSIAHDNKLTAARQPSMRLNLPTDDDSSSDWAINGDSSSVSRIALLFPPVRHLWPNKDTVDGLAQYLNDTTCRKYFGELSSMMTELTPTVFGAISDKYDGNRKLAQLVNRPVTDWIRDRWLHCINIVASDYFLGNDLIRLSIYANKMRHSRQPNNVDNFNSHVGLCRSFRKIEHLLDKSKIPIQFAYQQSSVAAEGLDTSQQGSSFGSASTGNFKGDSDIVRHTSSNGNQILLKPLTSGGQSASRDRRDSFVDNVSDGFTNLVSSFKRLFSL